jgi:nardilysin
LKKIPTLFENLILNSNRLKILNKEDLVMSDNEHEKPEVEKAKRISAAAMAVSAGSFHEPSDCGGLAHFCEHMIFMGSKKYPDENLFDSFVSKFSGSDNAYTDCEATVYEMDVAPSKFKEALGKG